MFVYDVTNRKLYVSEQTPLYKNKQKEREKHLMETTKIKFF